MSEAATPRCPRCKGEMRARSSKHGPWWACANFPTCRGKLDGRAATDDGAAPIPARPPPLGPYPGCGPLAWAPPPSTLQLDAFQRAVVDWRQGEVVVAAAAGSGKTTCAVERIIALLREGETPERVLVLVYNRSAAETVRLRLSAAVGSEGERVNVFTFHAWCYALLRHWYPTDSRLAHGRILGTPGAPHPVKLAAPLLEELKLDLAWRRALSDADKCAEGLVDYDSRGVDEQIARVLGIAPAGTPFSPEHAVAVEPHATFLHAWRKRKRDEGVIEFSDMLGDVALAVTKHKEALGYLSSLYAHIMVDEAQDVSRARAAIAAHLGAGARSLMWIGDARQAIYQFAAADPEVLIERAGAAGTLALPVNRRSARRVVDHANAIAEGQPWNLGGASLARDLAPLGEPVQVRVQETEGEEAAEVIEDILRRVAAGRPMLTAEGTPAYCVLARTNAMLVALESAHVARGVPVQVAGSPGGVWGSSVGQSLLTYLEAASGVPTWGLLDVANVPKRFAKKEEVRGAIVVAQEREKTGKPADIVGALKAAPGAGARRLGTDIERAGRLSWDTRVAQCLSWLGASNDEDDDGAMADGDQDRAEALKALGALAVKLGSLAGIYAYKRAQSGGERTGSVWLSTIHKAKGSEWPVVYVCGARAGKLPHSRCVTVDEERRLLYVACTRARDVLMVTTGGKPSPFLADVLPP